MVSNGMRRTWVAILGMVLVASAPLAAPAQAKGRPIRHVWVIELENKDYDTTFGPDSPAKYLSKTLVSKGRLLPNYYGIGHLSLDNYIAQVSGQAPNMITQSDCQFYQEFLPGLPGPNGQSIGQGCVYPPSVLTVGDQLEAAHRTWRQYAEDIPAPCYHPDLNSRDPYQSASADNQFATRHTPFLYFHSVIDQESCAQQVVGMPPLTRDLRSVATTPNFSFITPDLCSDGHDTGCADGRPGGLVSIDAFLKTWVPRIMASPAFKQDGLIIVTFDEAEFPSDSSSCCNQPMSFNTPMQGVNGPGGGRVGAVLLSPFLKGGSKDTTAYNHYGFLRTIEDLFGLDPLGHAATATPIKLT
jgi:hypothetical protein